jgi:drug/metabolite transporter (DMT)-like permease
LYLGEAIDGWRLAGAALVIAAIILGALASETGSAPLSKR